MKNETIFYIIGGLALLYLYMQQTGSNPLSVLTNGGNNILTVPADTTPNGSGMLTYPQWLAANSSPTAPVNTATPDGVSNALIIGPLFSDSLHA